MNLCCERLKDEVISMSIAVAQSLRFTTLEEYSLEDIFELEDEINRHHVSIDNHVLQYIALKTPAARDLRAALCATKINGELERIGDQAMSIKRHFRYITSPVAQIKSMRNITKRMLKLSTDGFIKEDVKMAANVIQIDQEVNDLNSDTVRDVITKTKSSDISYGEGIAIIRTAKSFERIGDLATNIAEAVIFMVSGEDIRHNHKIKDGIKDNFLNIKHFLQEARDGVFPEKKIKDECDSESDPIRLR